MDQSKTFLVGGLAKNVSIALRDEPEARQYRISAMVSFAAYIVAGRSGWDLWSQWMFISMCYFIAWELLPEKKA
jgi:hypothetical protein